MPGRGGVICQWGINKAVRANSRTFHQANSGTSAGPIAGHPEGQ